MVLRLPHLSIRNLFGHGSQLQVKRHELEAQRSDSAGGGEVNGVVGAEVVDWREVCGRASADMPFSNPGQGHITALFRQFSRTKLKVGEGEFDGFCIPLSGKLPTLGI